MVLHLVDYCFRKAKTWEVGGIGNAPTTAHTGQAQGHDISGGSFLISLGPAASLLVRWLCAPPTSLQVPPWGGAVVERRGALPPPGLRGALRAGQRGRPGPALRAAQRMESLALAGGAASLSGRARRARAFV